jgi:hypothetical protein
MRLKEFLLDFDIAYRVFERKLYWSDIGVKYATLTTESNDQEGMYSTGSQLDPSGLETDR